MHEAKNISLLLCDSYFICAVMCGRMPACLTVDLQHGGGFGFAHAVFCDTHVSTLVLCSDPYQTQAVVTTDLKSTRPRRWKETVVVREESKLNSHRTFLLQPVYILTLFERTFLWDSIKYATAPQTLGNTNYILFFWLLALFYLTVERRQKTIWEENGIGIKIQVSSLGSHLSSQTAAAIYLNGKRLKSLKMLPKKTLI